MGVYEFDPLSDPRWPEFLQNNPRASVFHTPGWLRALKQTYGYEPVVYTTTPATGELKNGWVFCRVFSWLTGRRLVSLPFSDHCEPLVDKPEHLAELALALRRDSEERSCKYIEYRPLGSEPLVDGFETSETFLFHKLNLEPDLGTLFRGLHKSSTQRKIRRAEREHLTYQDGCSEALLDQFYRLLVLTRRRHGLPPQPRKWFSSLAAYMGDRLKIRVAWSQNTPVATILTLRFKSTLMYKYGGADERFFSLGGTQMLFWQAIEEGKESGLREFDLGRSEPDARGLIVLKDRLGAVHKTLSYFRYPARLRHPSFAAHPARHVRKLLSHVPNRIVIAGGKLLYKHFG